MEEIQNIDKNEKAVYQSERTINRISKRQHEPKNVEDKYDTCSTDQEYQSRSRRKVIKRGRKRFKRDRDANKFKLNDNSAKPVREPILLRPVGSQVPRAPSNSTQFIIDSHEESSLFLDFNESSNSNKVREEDGSSPFPAAEWLPYNVADYKHVYRTFKEEKYMNLGRVEVKKRLLAAHEKVRQLKDQLSASPSRMLESLQSRLLELQEQNAALFKLRQEKDLEVSRQRQEFSQRNQRSSSTSSSSSSSSTSSSSSDSHSTSNSESSDSSSSECMETEESLPHIPEDEKENAQPSVQTGTESQSPTSTVPDSFTSS